MLGASNQHKLPSLFFYTTAGRIRDVTATICAHAARSATIMIGINSRAHELGYDSDFTTFEPDLWRDATSMIGDPLATDMEPPLEVVMNSEPIGYLAHNAILLLLIMLKNALVVIPSGIVGRYISAAPR
jgi:hypothetical protein